MRLRRETIFSQKLPVNHVSAQTERSSSDGAVNLSNQGWPVSNQLGLYTLLASLVLFVYQPCLKVSAGDGSSERIKPIRVINSLGRSFEFCGAHFSPVLAPEVAQKCLAPPSSTDRIQRETVVAENFSRNTFLHFPVVDSPSVGPSTELLSCCFAGKTIGPNQILAFPK